MATTHTPTASIRSVNPLEIARFAIDAVGAFFRVIGTGLVLAQMVDAGHRITIEDVKRAETR
jgi:hypothetical protein